MDKVLKDFLKHKTSLDNVRATYGSDLHNAQLENPVCVFADDVIFIIREYLSGEISLTDLLQWVNIIWFTDLYEYNPKEEDSIASVITELEALDEDGVGFSESDFSQMIDCLKNNREYERKNKMKDYKAFLYMFYALDEIYTKNPNEALGNYLSSLNPFLFKGKGSAVAAEYIEFREKYIKAFGTENPEMVRIYDFCRNYLLENAPQEAFEAFEKIEKECWIEVFERE